MKRFVAILLFISLSVALVACSNKAAGGESLYRLKCEYFETGLLTVKEEIEYPLPADGENVILDFYAQSSYSAENSGGSVELLSVKVDGTDSWHAFSDSGALEIKFNKKRKKGQRVKIGIDYALKLSRSADRIGYGDKSVNLGNFFPQVAAFDTKKGDTPCGYYGFGDPFNTSVSEYEVELTVPSQYVVASSAKATSLDKGEDKTTYRYEQGGIRDFAFALSKNYNVEARSLGDTAIYYCYYNDENAQESADTALAAIEWFSEKFGEYDMDIFTAAQTEFMAGGMEYPALCFISDSLSDSDRQYALVHEIAHQWWYSAVGNDQVDESFLDESLAEYSTYLFFDENVGYLSSGEEIISAAAAAVNVCETAFSKSDDEYIPSVLRSLGEFKNEYEYVTMVYNKGLVMLKAAENAVGREKMIKCLAEYFAAFNKKKAKADDFLSFSGSARPLIETFLLGKTRVFI